MSAAEPRIVAVIQARMGSTRLPGKVLADVSGRPLLGRVIDRVRPSRAGGAIVVATTTDPSDDAVEAFARAEGVMAFRGSAEDVLARTQGAAALMEAEVIVRVTSDDPFKDPDVIDTILDVFLKGGCDYASNTLEPSWPEGVDIEVVSRAALERAHAEAVRPFEREHVMPYIWMRPQDFRLRSVRRSGRDLSSLRWTVDTPEDMAFASAVYAALGASAATFRVDDVVALLDADPALAALSPIIPRNAGLAQSIQSENAAP